MEGGRWFRKAEQGCRLFKRCSDGLTSGCRRLRQRGEVNYIDGLAVKRTIRSPLVEK